MTDYKRDDLIRMVEMPDAQFELRADDEGEGLGTLIGYAARFNIETVIHGWEGHFREVIAPGAFKKTLEERGDKVKILFNHGMDPSIGDKPLGRASIIEEDKTGLRVEVPLDDTSYNRDLAASIRSGALDGMSFRFSVVRDEEETIDDDLPLRTLKEVRLFEVGPVTFPAYEATSVGIRGQQAYQVYRTAAADSGTADIEEDTPPILAPVTREERQHIARPLVAMPFLETIEGVIAS